ncbi:hypothetical protein [[Kitasatospora] papulosa]|uniref:hypothetical protein n=1 Tax=[Kitasatospora] papulosa TaxID=1464011 RepID=UPI0036C7E399
MSDGPRYFTKDGEAIHVVRNLKDAEPYTRLGYREVDEAAYLAATAVLRDLSAGPDGNGISAGKDAPTP